jgi:Concanavalin A-like lectin/glucanases superfamily/Secretion system C-terminal sorting domain
MKNKKTLLFIILILGTSIGYSQPINLNFGLQASYTFSGNANDMSGNGNDGTTFGSPTLTTDRFGNPNSAYEFDGIDDLINTYSTFDYPNRSLSLWVNPYDINGSGPTAHVVITQDDYTLNNGVLRVDFTNGEMNLWAGGNTGIYTTSAVALNQWMHLVLIREGAVSKYYVDNVLVHTSTADGYGSTVDPDSSFIIGSGRSTIKQFFIGKIDDIRIYDRAINTCEREALFSGNTTNLDSGLQANYTFSGNANDISGNSNDGTIFGSPTLTTDRFGNLNSAYEFDGIDDLINTYSTFDYPNRSLSLWVNPYNINGSGPTAHVVITQDDYTLNNGVLRVDFTNGEMNLWAGGNTGIYSTNTVALNSWMHLVLIREGSVCRYYVDNVLVHTSTADGYGSTVDPDSSFIIGSGRSTIKQFFIGKIDDIRIYDRAINECEIDSLFNQTNMNTGVNDIVSGPIINIYPNPTNSSITIEQNLELPFVKIELINCMGEIIETFQVKDHKVKIDMTNLNAGIYFVRLLSETSSIIREVIKY